MIADHDSEWLETDGLGGFASGTVNTIRTRRYHGLLLAAVTPPTGRVMLVNGCDAWVDTPDGRIEITAQRYVGAVHPAGHERIIGFTTEPWPMWTFDLGARGHLRLEILALHARPVTVMRWTVVGDATGVSLHVRPLISGRDYHGLQRENTACAFETAVDGERLRWRPYADRPVIHSATNGTWEQAPAWYRDFFYTAEQQRGLDAVEDLASPGLLHFDLARGPALWVMGTHDSPALRDVPGAIDDEQRRRAAYSSPLLRAADAYLVARGAGQTIVAGYPWFTDWGRDTFIAMRGLCLATGREDVARDILLEWCSTISSGMLPNRFPDGGDAPEYNSVDASLWFVIAAGELLARTAGTAALSPHDRWRLEDAMVTVVEGLARGTRYGIRCDGDGLLACGAPGVQLTWMDAKVGDRVITPRIGKPVEIQALWINALWLAAGISPRWNRMAERAVSSFHQRFPDEGTGGLYDVVDVDHVPGTADRTLRPNQVLAIGGLPRPVVEGDLARRVMDTVERHLLTPTGLRTLSPESPDYVPHYEGDGARRDASYHQGTAWPWLMGSFVDAWLRVRDDSAAAREEARQRFLAPLKAHLEVAGLGHVSEITDADAPYTPRGCPFQAWSLGELIRLHQRLTYT